MTPQQKGVYRMMLHARLSKLAGIAFQNFFSDVMKYANPDFVPVKPQGNQGDWKNDGHDPKSGRYYQVYSPEQMRDEAAAVAKLEEDFEGLNAKWGDKSVYPNGVKEFWFVINDHYRVMPGGYPTTLASLEALREKHGLQACELFLCKDLEDVLLNLSEDQVIAIVGFPPNPAEIKLLNLGVVNEVIVHIVEHTTPRSLAQSLVDPDFEEKINFNTLVATAHWLREGSYRTGTLEDYFSANSNFTRQQIRDRLKGIYEESGNREFPSEQNVYTAEDQRLVYMLNEITPIPLDNDQRVRKELQDAALVVLSYFFEACDIFEEPQNVNA